MTPVVLSGGSGTRLWPVSRTKLPKQFCQIFEHSLQSLTLLRAQKLGTPWVLTSQTLQTLTEQNFRELGLKQANALYEPMAKNTAPAIAFLCRHFMVHGKGNEVVVMLPADQLVEDEEAFTQAINLASREAENGKVVTLGIRPDFPATGYGYIQTESSSEFASTPVLKFHEKPEFEKAKAFLDAGNFFWNAGIFIFKISVMAELLASLAPEIWRKTTTLLPDLSNLNEVYKTFTAISIDYAVMEKLTADVLHCIPVNLGWNDVGSWDAVASLVNTHSEPSEVIEVDAKNNFIHRQTGKVYAFVGVEDLIVADTRDALLITRKGATQNVKGVVEKLKSERPHVLNEHTSEDRPWGHFEILKDASHYKSKIIKVNPYQQISYQSHKKREEHWMFIRGEGEVVLDDKIIPVKAGTYVKIPLAAKHRIRNTGGEEIEFIELQLGTYFGEDDITRYQDDYQRN